ncbi:hypothetical protein WG907_10000 [Sphingobium sp. AN558]|uniref:hypothetical protein n=1 Tax=Sphingobium sp. AN558 TaxID=3133442 RepID=UPI0030C55825
MRFTMKAVGLLLILMGLLWVGQGTGVVHWPESSFMIDQRPWIWRGALLAALGVAMILIAGRARR